MTRRLLISYLSLAVVVLAMLEVPLGFINARGERARLTSKVERDAVTIASLAESTVEGEASTSNLAALKALGKRYAADTGARVVITNRKGIALVDPSPPGPGRRSFATRPEFRAALRGDYATGIRHSSTLGYDLLYVAVPIASGGVVHGAVRITYPTSELDRRVRNYWLALAGHRRGRARGGDADRTAIRPLDPPAARGSRARRGGRRRRRSRVRARRCRTAPPEIRKLTLEFNDMVARVEGLVSAQQEFVADASHELRTPLTALRLRLENLERHVGDGGRGSLDAAESRGGAPLGARRRAARARPGRRRNGSGGQRSTWPPSPASGSTRCSRARAPFASSSSLRSRLRQGPERTGSRR